MQLNVALAPASGRSVSATNRPCKKPQSIWALAVSVGKYECCEAPLGSRQDPVRFAAGQAAFFSNRPSHVFSATATQSAAQISVQVCLDSVCASQTAAALG
jgi:hypothetical protein